MSILFYYSSCFHPQRIAYSLFQERYAKAKGMKLKHLWCRQLRQIPRCTATKTLIIVRQYPTLTSLMNAYKKLSNISEREALLKDLCDHHNRNAIGLSLSRSIYHALWDK